MQSISSWQFGFGTAKDSNSKARAIRVLLLGQHGVGKTAIAVRFATRRFIGEYDSSAERVYRVESQQPHQTSWEIADPPGELAGPPSESRLRWADAVILVYSVTDRVSFEEFWRLRFLLNLARKPSKRLAAPVVLLVGNKRDLAGPPGGDRMVATDEGRKRAVDIGAQAFYEISARESFEEVMVVFANIATLVPLLRPTPANEAHQPAPSFRLRASTDSSIEARRRPQVQLPLFRRRLSISARGAPH